ncbi:hypothetical protein X994_863 [Burkholderia pseudomallei]|uniref:hypothetical protein n=1 Tax=Burkholderia pseudomallei TaxID=28450 RepID=UPI00052A8AFD|nr:hypothetical protein [Burkholderia pseudomallei]AIV50294.1 hypothetical protein Y603_998 [Burkholderia pseudomallei MSHR1153]AIV77877.1 hypothetical protein X994_863 [Burkholderia pseudomallei]AIV90202.1 hypothetical protein X995_2466 [Burkholderia pseudomallei B03]AIV96493.1 hypothetical protein X996_2416 [Burkholderia pseudomallei A79A]KGU76638.1 hypothetical protein Y038_565 [Burkholderia pseudomallei MSHR543]
MIFNPQQIKLLALGMPAVPANGGGGSSDSKSTTTTSNADQRLSVASSGIGATASSGGSVTLNVQQLDAGAVTQSFGLAHDALAGLESFGTASMSSSAHTAEQAIKGMLNDSEGVRQAYADAASAAISAARSAANDSASAYSSAAQQVTTAYQDAKTGNQRTIMIGAFIVAALAVSMPFLAREMS